MKITQSKIIEADRLNLLVQGAGFPAGAGAQQPLVLVFPAAGSGSRIEMRSMLRSMIKEGVDF